VACAKPKRAVKKRIAATQYIVRLKKFTGAESKRDFLRFNRQSELGAIVVVDLKNGKARRLLQDYESTKAEPDVKLVVDGHELIDQQKKTAP
jgi:uncharacterized LabA/DUF88 family protein